MTNGRLTAGAEGRPAARARVPVPVPVAALPPGARTAAAAPPGAVGLREGPRGANGRAAAAVAGLTARSASPRRARLPSRPGGGTERPRGRPRAGRSLPGLRAAAGEPPEPGWGPAAEDGDPGDELAAAARLRRRLRARCRRRREIRRRPCPGSGSGSRAQPRAAFQNEQEDRPAHQGEARSPAGAASCLAWPAGRVRSPSGGLAVLTERPPRWHLPRGRVKGCAQTRWF